MSRRTFSVGIMSLAAMVMVALVPPAALAATGSSGIDNAGGSTAAPQAVAGSGTAGVDLVSAFPSASSTVVASVGFIDGTQVGYFWSASRGDSVAETLPGPGRIKKAILKGDVIQNVLSNGAHVDWTLSINGIDVGNFQVVQGQLGPFSQRFTFPRITGGSYAVKIRVTNEVAGGEGSITLCYAGACQHVINLKRR